MRAAWSLALLAACSGPPTGAVIDAARPADARLPDAGTPDAMPPTLAPTVVFDDIHIAGLTEEAHAFSLLGQVVNPQLATAIQDGQLLLGAMLIALDDPSGQSNDDDLDVGLVTLADPDGDPSDDFDADHPELFDPAPGTIGADGTPTILLGDATIAAGLLHAEGSGDFAIGGLPLPLQAPTLDGRLDATAAEDAIRTLSNGRLRGAVPAVALSLLPNITGGMCPGQTMLDVIALGCGFLAMQPDVDLDGDGLERLYDSAGDFDAGTATDGRIDRCVDGDGTEILGTDCVSDSRIADGYRLILVVHGVRAYVRAP